MAVGLPAGPPGSGNLLQEETIIDTAAMVTSSKLNLREGGWFGNKGCIYIFIKYN
jgi:hypothetical protein